MKKKLLIALLAITMAFSCAFGFAACDNEQPAETNVGLTAEELKQAIQATLNAKNAKIHITEGFFDNDENTLDYTYYYDDINGVGQYENIDELAGYIVMGQEWLYDCRLQDGIWDIDGFGIDTIGEYINSMVHYCDFKAKDDNTSQFVSFEETYASFKYDSKTDTYMSSLLSKDKGKTEASIFELQVSLSVKNGYVTEMQVILNNESGNVEFEYMNYTYSDFGIVEVIVPDEVTKLVQEKEQNN